MEVQFTENKPIEQFMDVDDLYKAYLVFVREKEGRPLRRPTRSTQPNPSEICTILVSYNHSGYKCFEYYYRELILKRYNDCFPDAPRL